MFAVQLLAPALLALAPLLLDAESDAFAAAFALKKEGKSAEAAAAFEAIAQHFPTSPRVGEALVEAGVSHFALGRSKQVLHRSPPESAAAFETALGLFERVVATRPEDPAAGRAQYMRGSTQLFLGDLPGAEAEYTAVLERYSRDTKYAPKALERRAVVHRHLLQSDLALADLSRYQKDYPKGEEAAAVARSLKQSASLDRAAPPLDVESWLQGAPTSIEALRGKVVALYFFATWCENCEKERPFVMDLERRHAPAGLVWIGVFDRQKGQTPESVRAWLAEKRIAFPAVMDGARKTTKAYQAESVPDLVLIDKAGNVRWHDSPANLADYTIETLLAEEHGNETRPSSR